jgi:hypothetical protein
MSILYKHTAVYILEIDKRGALQRYCTKLVNVR